MTNKSDYIKSIKRAQDAAFAYYQGEDSPLSDIEYDSLISEITALGEANSWNDHLILLTEVGTGVTGKTPLEDDVVYKNKMLSLKKATKDNELDAFLSKIQGKIVFEPKLDGLASVAKYVKGNLIRLSTRGNGLIGKDVTLALDKISLTGLPKKLLSPLTIEIRGEIYATKESLEEANKWRIKNNQKPYELERSAAAGVIMSAKSMGEKCLDENMEHIQLFFGCYYVSGVSADNYSEAMNIVSQQGITVVKDLYNAPDLSPKEIIYDFKNTTVNFPFDGIVIKTDSYEEQEKLGNTNRHPNWALAWKYEEETKKGVIDSIVRNVGRTGAVSYVAVFKETVFIGGSNVGRVTLNNAQHIADLDVRIGDTVTFRKANGIIPEILSVSLIDRPTNSVPYEASRLCPGCQAPLDTTSSIIWRCVNDDCVSKNIEKLITAMDRDHMNIKNVSRSFVENLVNLGVVSDLSDMYKLTDDNIHEALKQNDNAKGPRPETVAKIRKAIEDSANNSSLDRIIASLGIHMIGRTISRALAKQYATMESLLQESDVNIVANVPTSTNATIGLVAAAKLIEGLKKNQHIIEALKNNGVYVDSRSFSLERQEGILSGEIVCVSGKIEGYTRNEAKALIEEHGGVATSNVNKKTTLLVCDKNSTSSKKINADKLGVKILSPDEFLEKLVA